MMRNRWVILGILFLSLPCLAASRLIYPKKNISEVSVTLPRVDPTNDIYYARDNIPFEMTRLIANQTSKGVFVFTNGMSDAGPDGKDGGGCYEWEFKTDLPLYTTIGDKRVFKLTDKLGLIIQAGSPWVSESLDKLPQPTPDGLYSQSSTGWCGPNFEDLKVKVTPVLISNNKETAVVTQTEDNVGQLILSQRQRILTMRTVKPKTMPPSHESSGKTQEYVNRLFNGFDAIVADEIPIYINPFTYNVKRMTCAWRNPNDIINDFAINGGQKYAALKNQVVHLPTIGIRSLQNQGEVYGGRINLFWERDCSQKLDVNGNELIVYTNFTDSTNPGNTTDVLSLTADSTAKGVGIKIYPGEETQAIQYGAEGDRSKQRVFLKARSQPTPSYYRIYYAKTSNNVSPGTVKAIVTYTFSYR